MLQESACAGSGDGGTDAVPPSPPSRVTCPEGAPSLALVANQRMPPSVDDYILFLFLSPAIATALAIGLTLGKDF